MTTVIRLNRAALDSALPERDNSEDYILRRTVVMEKSSGNIRVIESDFPLDGTHHIHEEDDIILGIVEMENSPLYPEWNYVPTTTTINL